MNIRVSPLRYPGGKAKLTDFFHDLLSHIGSSTYVEPFAGGAGAAVTLLTREVVNRIWINDFDQGVHAFWHSVINHPDRLIKKIENAVLTVPEWEVVKKRYSEGNHQPTVDLGFDFFFLNRTNHSGIVSGAPIGGFDQNGSYGIDARFNKVDLAERVRHISKYRKRIKLTNLDAVVSMAEFLSDESAFVYVDPPYVKQGNRLYFSNLNEKSHRRIAGQLKKAKDNWLLTYDDHELIRELYRSEYFIPIDINYSLRRVRVEKELMVASRRVASALVAS